MRETWPPPRPLLSLVCDQFVVPRVEALHLIFHSRAGLVLATPSCVWSTFCSLRSCYFHSGTPRHLLGALRRPKSNLDFRPRSVDLSEAHNTATNKFSKARGFVVIRS
ncbi:hypothetical protein GQ607_014120 [Colletotrichum asianum]|uniref:Uncharacterized protein n=1 Tax=Colletotrichum asianum TaxID=702518 RepID=A0A8H3W2E5_9PEZI|nr:hypothetical protein GQ607_014120 [Colletotrichum asianum]